MAFRVRELYLDPVRFSQVTSVDLVSLVMVGSDLLTDVPTYPGTTQPAAVDGAGPPVAQATEEVRAEPGAALGGLGRQP